MTGICCAASCTGRSCWQNLPMFTVCSNNTFHLHPICLICVLYVPSLWMGHGQTLCYSDAGTLYTPLVLCMIEDWWYIDSNAIMQPLLAMAMAIAHVMLCTPILLWCLRLTEAVHFQWNQWSLSFLLRRNIHYMLVHKWWVCSFTSHTTYMCYSPWLLGQLDAQLLHIHIISSRAVTVPLSPHTTHNYLKAMFARGIVCNRVLTYVLIFILSHCGSCNRSSLNNKKEAAEELRAHHVASYTAILQQYIAPSHNAYAGRKH